MSVRRCVQGHRFTQTRFIISCCGRCLVEKFRTFSAFPLFFCLFFIFTKLFLEVFIEECHVKVLTERACKVIRCRVCCIYKLVFGWDWFNFWVKKLDIFFLFLPFQQQKCIVLFRTVELFLFACFSFFQKVLNKFHFIFYRLYISCCEQLCWTFLEEIEIFLNSWIICYFNGGICLHENWAKFSVYSSFLNVQFVKVSGGFCVSSIALRWSNHVSTTKNKSGKSTYYSKTDAVWISFNDYIIINLES